MIVLYIMIGLAAIILGVCYYTYRTVFYSGHKNNNGMRDIPEGEQYKPYTADILSLVDELTALPYEQVYIMSRDGLKLSAKYYHIADGAPLQIMFHGYRGAAERDFCGGHKICRESGCNALLVDQRAHGDSQGSTITFGIKERYDCLDWVNYAAGRFGKDTKIILCGISMGAATVLMASDLHLPENVIAITADCGYSSPREIICEVLRQRHLPVSLAYPLIRLGARIYGRFDLEESAAVTSLPHCRVPVLIIHGGDDLFVPCEMGRVNYGACASEKQILTVPGAGHGISYFVDMPGYIRVCNDFINNVLISSKNNLGTAHENI